MTFVYSEELPANKEVKTWKESQPGRSRLSDLLLMWFQDRFEDDVSFKNIFWKWLFVPEEIVSTLDLSLLSIEGFLGHMVEECRDELSAYELY